MKKTFFVVGVLVCAVVLGGLWFSRVPDDPIYQGKRLSEWLRVWGENSDGDRPASAIRSIGSDAVPWLMWAVENGRQPNPPPGPSTLGGRPPSLLDSLRNWLFPRASDGTPYFDERAHALKALFLVGKDRADVIEFVKRLTGDPKAGEAAAGFLARKGGDQAQYILQLSAEGSPAARINAVNAFNSMPTGESDADWNRLCEKTVPALVHALRDPDPMVRAAAAIAYGNTPNLQARRDSYQAALPILIGLLSDPVWQVRDGAGWALFTMEGEASAAVPAAIPLLADPEPFVRRRLARALGRIDKVEQRSRQALLKMANDPGDFNCRVAATEALGQFGVRASLVDELIAQLESTEATERGKAMCALVDIGPPAADSMPKILKAMERKAGYPANYSILITNFDRFGAKEALPNLIFALSHPDAVVREYAALELDSPQWDKKDPLIEMALVKATRDTVERVRNAADKALRRIRDTQ